MGELARKLAADPELAPVIRQKNDLLQEAHDLLADERRDEAAPKFREAARLEGRLARMYAERGLTQKAPGNLISAANCWYMAGEPRAAIQTLHECLDRYPNAPEVDRANERLRAFLAVEREETARQPEEGRNVAASESLFATSMTYGSLMYGGQMYSTETPTRISSVPRYSYRKDTDSQKANGGSQAILARDKADFHENESQEKAG